MESSLQGIKVVDLSRVLAGPYCTMILGDLGANVIKVEAPGGSDDTHQWGSLYNDADTAYYFCTNRNKRGMTLNLKSPEGREVLKRLLQDADVVIHNFKVGSMEEWGFGYEELAKEFPGLIYCSISGYGQTGKYKDLPSYDFLVQGMGGMMSITGTEEGGPMKVGVAIADIATGLYAATGILAALHERERSGKGQKIAISLLDSQISLLVNVASNYLIHNQIPKRYGNHHPNIVPYQTFQTKDGTIIIAVGNDGQFAKLCGLLGKPEWAQDPRYATNPQRLAHREEVVGLLAGEIARYPTDDLLQRLKENKVPGGPLYGLQELFADDVVVEQQMKIEMEHPKAGVLPMVGSPLKLSRTPVQFAKYPPGIGEHTAEILKEHGWEEDAIALLQEKGIV
jgi:crotonobetainyl-CoA:carnitine CoA-transferase CaiB-like acyl-CoA transferase